MNPEAEILIGFQAKNPINDCTNEPIGITDHERNYVLIYW